MRTIRRYQFFRHASSDAALDHMRHLADLVIAAVLLVITFPLMLAISLAITWEGPGPIFERQTCIGRGSRRFQLLKFRTMVIDDQTAPAWARKTTRIGEFLRYTRIESLPQLHQYTARRDEPPRPRRKLTVVSRIANAKPPRRARHRGGGVRNAGLRRRELATPNMVNSAGRKRGADRDGLSAER